MQKLSVGATRQRTEAGQVNDLTKPERIQLEELETVISNGIQTFAEVGNALLAIREAKLYRAEHGTFEAYCLKRWGFNSSRARQLIGAAEIVDTLKSVTTVTPPQSERVVRPLTKLPAAEQPAAWQAATDKAQSEGRTVRARDVEEAVEEKRAQEEARYPQSADRHETPSERSKVLRPETDGHKKPPTEPVVKSKIGPPANGMQFVRMAIMDMEQIKENDTERKSAFTEMRRWLDEHE
jgi:hypothetical protein